jgi:uncharacterized membrane protein SpoIIM required for sporulation
VRGLGWNTVVSLTPEGLRGVSFSSVGAVFMAVLLPVPLLITIYFVTQAGALAVYAVAWIALSLLLFDELRWMGFRRMESDLLPGTETRKASWLVPWGSLRMADWNGRTLWFTALGPPRKISVTFDRKDSQLVVRSLESWNVRYSWKPPRLPQALTRFSTLALMLFVASQLILVLAAVLPFFPGEEQMYNTILNGTTSQVKGATFMEAFRAIYFNNVQVAWGGMLPVLGQLSFGLASYNTGRIIQVIAITQHYPTSVVLVSLYLLPHTWVEESAYPIATVAGLLAVTRWRSVSPGEFAHRINWGSWKLVLAMVGVALILLAAGLIETAGLYLGTGELVMWIPVGVVVYLMVALSRGRARSSRS